jgi:hypothetical protein
MTGTDPRVAIGGAIPTYQPRRCFAGSFLGNQVKLGAQWLAPCGFFRTHRE